MLADRGAESAEIGRNLRRSTRNGIWSSDLAAASVIQDFGGQAAAG